MLIMHDSIWCKCMKVNKEKKTILIIPFDVVSKNDSSTE